MGSLRFRLPALFLLGIVLAGVVAALISLRLFQTYTRDQSVRELEREASGLSRLYADAALRAADEGSGAIDFAASELELATGDRIFYIGASLFPGQDSGLPRLAEALVPPEARALKRPVSFEFTPPGSNRAYLAASGPVRLEPGSEALGAIIVAKPRTELRDQWLSLVVRLTAAFAIGALLAGILSWWLSRRITGPVLALSSAADEIAAGNYAVRVPAGEGGDEISHLSQRFNEMAARLSATEERERQFLMSVSHELRTPLTAIKGHVDAIRDGLFDDPEAERASLDVVASETVRLERLVGDVLDLAKLNAHRFTVHAEEVAIGALVAQAHAGFGEEARARGVTFRLDSDPAAPTIVTDGDRVMQVLTNLLANAFRWTPDGGTISIGSASGSGEVSIDVRDTGPGIGPDERERIFVPFISRDNHGTGLGLPIARELALALGGRIELESTVGEGSRFRLVLPERPA
ncbi:MAG: HAMP domain-containing histidine kinase [Thermoleophilia bacterium]|nr:HAMP domain-containing histidine kinase [Thermoleophilia bacterium]